MERPTTKQSAELSNGTRSIADNFWQEYLEGIDPVHFPPCLTANEAVSASEKLEQHCLISDDLGTRGGSLHTAILLAWALTISQYTDSEEALFARLQDTVRDALSQISKTQAQMAPFQTTPLERIRHLSTDTARACQFQNVLAIVSSPHQDGPLWDGPLTVLCEVDGSSRVATIKAVFDSKGIPEAQVRWALEQFKHNLRRIVLHHPEQTLAAVGEACPEHLDRLASWYAKEPDRIEERVDELILKNCATRPDSTAVSAWDGEFTYQELDDLSSSLASRLQRQHAVGPSVYVPVYSERSKHIPVAILAIMRAGGAFLLLSDAQPLGRVKELCQRISASVILASSTLASSLSQSDQPVITLGADPVEEEKESLDDAADMVNHIHTVPSAANPDDPVYIVFTSGSSGTPKGVVIRHGALATNAVRLSRELGCNDRSRWLSCASFAFDISIMELVFPLVEGACVAMPPESQLANDLERAIQDFQTDVVVGTPMRVRGINPEKVPVLRTIIMGGEKPLQDDIDKWVPYVNLVQAYGPAECCLLSSKAIMKLDSQVNNVGRGNNSNLWIVHPQDPGKRLPLGCPGELLIEGPLVGQGYLNDPERTSASFVMPPPWLQRMRSGRALSQRCYRTGDIVAYSSRGDGSIMFLGRKDTQVKLRAQRIELGEVEAHLRSALPDASVVVDIISPENADDQRALTAFIAGDSTPSTTGTGTDSNYDDLFGPVGDSDFATRAAAASRYLHSRLPAYMVPTVFLPLRRIPQTASAKLDRRLLTQRASDLPRRTLQAYRAHGRSLQQPTTGSEQMIQEITAGVLKLDTADISMDDDFFHLGADSIDATRLVKSARERGINLTVADVFHFSRLRDIAAKAQAQAQAQACSDNGASIAPFSLISSAVREEIVQTTTRVSNAEASAIEDIYPCTPLQEALLAMSATRKGAVVDRFSVGLRPGVSLPRFRRAWDLVMQANPILRTSFAMDQHRRPFQVVLSQGPGWTEQHSVPLPEIRPGRPLISFGLEADSDDASTPDSVRFVLAMHHALYDGWSHSALLDQVEDAYCGRSIQTAPFNRFVRQVMSVDTGAAKVYWESQTAGYDSMPYPAARPSRKSVSGATAYVEDRIPLRAMRGITKASFINLGWAITLSQLTDSNDIVFGCTAAGRDFPVKDIEVVSGPVLAVVPLRIQLGQDDVAMDALKRAQLQTVDMAHFQHWGIQNIRRLSRSAEAACQFQNLVVTHPPAEDGKSSRVFTQVGDTDRDNSQFYTQPLVLLCFQFSDHIDARLRFDPDIIPATQARAMLDQFAHVLASLQAHPDQRIADIPSITRHDIETLRAWNSPEPVQVEACVHHLIENIAAKAPTHEAICSWDGSFTYGEINELASRLAMHLAAQGVGPETFVPICLKRSRWVVVAILGVMKAGGAFVLLEPAQPMPRLQNTCSQVDAHIIISSRRWVPDCSALPASIISISNEETEWQDPSVMASKPCIPAAPSNALYAVFTSGSTGRPKGVTGLSHESRLLHFSPFAFDAAITDLLAPLITGACICLPSAHERSNDLAGAAGRMRANTADLTPSMLRELDPDDFPSIELVIIGGEAASTPEIAKWSRTKRICNVYGPAECCDISTLQPNMTPQTGGTSIGYPLASDCWVVRPSNHNHLMPIGAVGELLIGGPKLARGYLKNPEETSRAFLSEPLPWQHVFRDPATSSMRLYKTGDLVRYGSDGALHFVGRKDMQIKLRGQRLEPAEIEAAIHRLLPRGSHVVVDAMTRSCDRSTALAAFIVMASDIFEPAKLSSSPVEEDLFVIPSPAVQGQLARINQALAQELPKFMAPARYFVLARMPLTVSEKLDRRRLKQCAEALSDEELRRLTSSSASSTTTRRAAASRSEEMLLLACTRVLSRRPETIGLDDSFFDLGGDSIIAISFTQEARKQGLSFEVFDVFRHPRLSDLAAASTVVDGKGAQSTEISTGFASYFGVQDQKELAQAVFGPHIPTDQISQLLPATKTQVAELHDPFHHFTFHFTGPLDPSRLEAACQRLVDRHEILRAVFLQVHGRVCQAILDRVDTVVHQRDCCRNKTLAEYVSMVCKENDLPPPAFGTPITKFTLVNGLSDERVLIIRLSHAQYDGYSLRLLIRELKALYEGNELPDPVPFSSFIHHWYRQQSNRDALRFWRDHLQGAKMTLFPGQSECPSPRAHEEEGKPTTVSVTSTEPVRLLPMEGVTLATTVEATWIILLGRLTQQRDLTFGVVTSGRNSGSQPDYLGCCINPIPLRTIVNPDWTVRELFLAVQKWYIDSMPFEHLQLEAIGPDKAPFGSVVIVQNTEPNREFDIDGIPCRAGRLGPLPNRPYLIVEAIPDESHRVSLRLTGAEEVLAGHRGQTMIKELAETLVRVGSDPGQRLSQFGLCP